MRPVRKRMCLYESLVNGALDLNDIALMNDTILVDADNEAIMHEIAKDAHRGR